MILGTYLGLTQIEIALLIENLRPKIESFLLRNLFFILFRFKTLGSPS